MKIIELEIEGFRSLKKVTWKPGDLNLIIGKNGSGKSNLLKMLELVAASAQGNLDSYINSSGGMNAMLWDGRTDNLHFRLLTSALDYRNRDSDDYKLTYDVTLKQIAKSSSYRVEREELANYELMKQGRYQKPFYLLQRTNRSGRLSTETQSMEASEKGVLEGETLLSSTSSPFVDQIYEQVALYRNQLTDWVIYQTIRTDREATIRQEVEVRAVNQVTPDGQNLVNVLHTLYESPDDPDFKERIDDAMRAAFGNTFKELKFSPDAKGRIQMGIRWDKLKRVNFGANLSDGTLRFLFLLTVLANPSPAPLIAIDEPEVGLHPSMLPIIAEFAADAATRTQVVLTTHSSQFLSAFDKDSRPTTTVANWLDGETTLTNLEGERLDYWLEQYSLGDLFNSGELENMASAVLESV